MLWPGDKQEDWTTEGHGELDKEDISDPVEESLDVLHPHDEEDPEKPEVEDPVKQNILGQWCQDPCHPRRKGPS